MSTIHFVPQVMDYVRTPEGKPSHPPAYRTPENAEHSQDLLVHAWSIGVTDAGRTFGEGVRQEQREPERETCPPEVYIG